MDGVLLMGRSSLSMTGHIGMARVTSIANPTIL